MSVFDSSFAYLYNGRRWPTVPISILEAIYVGRRESESCWLYWSWGSFGSGDGGAKKHAGENGELVQSF